MLRKKIADISMRLPTALVRSRLWLILVLLMAGCTTLKKAAVVGAGTLGVSALVSTVTSGTAPVLLAGAGTASVLTAGADLLVTPKGKNIMNDCAPDNFWSLLGSLIEMGGWALILIVIVPMLFSWLLPGPIKFKGRDKPPINPYLK